MKLLQWVKEIRSKEGELHFKRFAIFQTPRLSLYIHRLFKEDQDAHLHNHPWNFLTLVLRGCYFAEAEDGHWYLKRPGTWSRMTRDHYHKIAEIDEGPVTTLFLAYGEWQPWGYLVGDEHVEASEYRERKHKGRLPTDMADNLMKAVRAVAEKEIAKHHAAGRPICVWKNGKVVLVHPDGTEEVT